MMIVGRIKMEVSAGTSTYNQFSAEWFVSASTTTEPEEIKIDWSFLFKDPEEELREQAKKELERIKANKIHINVRRKDLFR